MKSEKHRDQFLRNAPDLVIVDEAHMGARPRGSDRVEHQRYQLLRDLAEDPNRHLILVTATPHSGFEESFRSLLGLLDREFDIQPDTSGSVDRKRLLPHIIQRRRKDEVRLCSRRALVARGCLKRGARGSCPCACWCSRGRKTNRP